MSKDYTIDDITTLSFREGVRDKIAMYLGSADMLGAYNAVQEIISNSIDEYYMGAGNKIIIKVEDNIVTVRDYGRGVPFGIKKDGTNTLVDIFSKAHTGGKFNNKVYVSVSGINGIGAKATALSSEHFSVYSYRDGKYGHLTMKKGYFENYEEGNTKEKNGTLIVFKLDQEVYNLEPLNIDFEEIRTRCKNLSYLTKGLTFELHHKGRKIVYCAEQGVIDLIKDTSKKPIHPTPIYITGKEDDIEYEIAMQWTKGREKSFVFTNGLRQVEGGTSLTGIKTAITTFMRKYFKGGVEDNNLHRTGLIYVVSCRVPNPSFANQTKTKINNPELRGICQRATGEALRDFAEARNAEFQLILKFLEQEHKAEAAAERARKHVLDTVKNVEQNQKKKVFASDKLKDAEFLGEHATLLITEGDSAAGSMAQARDIEKYGILAIRGKMINALANSEEKIFENEEIRLLLSAMNINPRRYNSKKLRYGSIAICSDADSDGGHIGLLIISALQYLCPEFIQEGRLKWLRSPLYIVKKGKKEEYYFTDEEFNKVKGKTTGEVQRNKGLGGLDANQARDSMFGEKQRMDLIIPDEEGLELLYDLMGDDVEPRREFVFSKIDFSEIQE